MSQYLIIGAHGRVGGYLLQKMQSQGLEVTGWTRKDCDLANGPQLEEMLRHCPYDCVINCSAVSGIEACLDDPVTAHLVNAIAPQLMARACRREGKRLIHLSTDYVLDGRRQGLKDESAKCKPVNVYGMSKEEGEWRVRDEHPEALIARVSWVFGNKNKPSFAEMVMDRAIAGQPISAVGDKDSMPTWIDDLSEWLIRLAMDTAMPGGIMHLCQSGEPVTWHDYACEVIAAANETGIHLKNTDVIEQKLDEQAGFRDARPRHTAMDNGKLAEYLQQPVRSWQEAIRCCLHSRHSQHS